MSAARKMLAEAERLAALSEPLNLAMHRHFESLFTEVQRETFRQFCDAFKTYMIAAQVGDPIPGVRVVDDEPGAQ